MEQVNSMLILWISDVNLSFLILNRCIVIFKNVKILGVIPLDDDESIDSLRKYLILRQKDYDTYINNIQVIIHFTYLCIF